MERSDKSIIVDPETGMVFRRRKPNAYDIPMSTGTSEQNSSPQFLYKSKVQEQPIYYQNDTHSVAFSESSMESSVKFNDPLPPPPASIPISEYTRFLPNNMTKSQKMKQLLIWIASNEQLNNKPSRLSPQAELKANEIKKKLIQKLINDEINVSLYARPETATIQPTKKNPVNIENEKKLAKLEKDIQTLKDELADWRTCSDKVFQLHAEAKDTIVSDPVVEYDDLDVESFADRLDDVQQQFLKEFCLIKGPKTEPLHAKLASMQSGMDELRQSLNTANQFVEQTKHYADFTLSRLAQKSKERSKLIPDEPDLPALLDDQQKRNIENDNVHKILKLFANQKISK